MGFYPKVFKSIVDFAAGLKIGGTAVTSTAAEINTLHGSGIAKADLQKLHGVTATAAEVNKLAGAGENVTAANLDELTGGAETDLHTHALANVAENVAAIAEPETALAADCASKLNAILTALKAAGLMTADS